MSLIIRADDFPGTKPDEFGLHNLENFKRFHHEFSKRNLSYVLGVIPGYTTPRDLSWLKDQSNITVAMHGAVHNESELDEFRDKRCVDIENTLLIMLSFMERILCTKIKDYIPPHNVINPDTILVLSRLGFSNVYGGPETEDSIKEFITLNHMKYIHSQFPVEYGRSDELKERGSVEHILKEKNRKDICLTLHWTWEYNIGLENLSSYLDLITR